MLEAAFSPFFRAAAAYASVANAVNVGVLKKIGLLKEGVLRISETLGSNADFNTRLDTGAKVPFLFHLVGEAVLTGLLDPSNEEDFLTWTLTGDSYVTLPGLVENGSIEQGRIRFDLYRRVDYSFEFTGNDAERYSYKGVKNLKSLKPVQAWTTLLGSLHQVGTEKKILESKVFSNQNPSAVGIFPFLQNIRIR